mgnify:CR=1 FL=1
MTVDSHVYCFQPGDHPAGFAEVEEHLMWIQSSQPAHHQPAWRTRDRAPVSSSPLAPENLEKWNRLPDVNFRIDREKGRVVWTVDGEDCTKQFLPPNLRNVEYTPGDGGPPQTIPKVSGPEDCPTDSYAWHYDDNNNPTQIVLCDFACSELSADLMGQIDIVLGCASVIK